VPEHVPGTVRIVTTIDAALDEAVERATVALDAATGSSSLCSLSRSGTPMPGIKYPEGAWAALRDAQRAVRSGGDPREQISAVRDRWRADLASHEQRGSGPDWIAYLTGGVDALDGLLESASGSLDD
jgi:hypothetical protein